MIQKNSIEEVKNRLVKAYNPVAIYLFGSYAWGNPTDDSDLELLIVVDTSNEKSYKRPLVGYDTLFDLGIAKDLIVYTKAEFNQRSKDVTTLCYKIEKEGRVLYARS